MASVCTVREALIKSTRTGSERFCLQTRYGKCGNTVCISHFSYRRLGVKDPLSAEDDLFRGSLIKSGHTLEWGNPSGTKPP